MADNGVRLAPEPSRTAHTVGTRESQMSTSKNALQQLRDQGQSPWLDFIARDLLTSGKLQRLIDQGIVGMTSNPTIFEKAIGGGSDEYDEALQRLVRAGKSIDE